MIKRIYRKVSMTAQLIWRHGPVVILLLLLLTYPLAFKYYTSIGIDLETPDGPVVQCSFWRVRWPGDGSVMFGREDEPRSADKKVLERFDLGGAFFRPPLKLGPQTFWHRMGFRWVNYDRSRDGPHLEIAPFNQRAILLGFPYWLIILGWAGVVFWLRKRRGRKNGDIARP